MELIGELGLDGLGDEEEEVCACAARALRFTLLCGASPASLLDPTWSALAEVECDDISTCVADLVKLLEQCYQQSQLDGCQEDLTANQLTRLLQLGHHIDPSVRRSAARCLGWVGQATVRWEVMVHCYRGILCDPDADAAGACAEAWSRLCQAQDGGKQAEEDGESLLEELLAMLLTPSGHVLQCSSLCDPSPYQSQSHSKRRSKQQGGGAGPDSKLHGKGITPWSRLQAHSALSGYLEASQGSKTKLVEPCKQALESGWSSVQCAALFALALCAEDDATLNVAQGVLDGIVSAQGEEGGELPAYEELRQVREYVGKLSKALLQQMLLGGEGSEEPDDDTLASVKSHLTQQESLLAARVRRRAAECILAREQFPQALSPVLRPLMEALKLETDEGERAQSARELAKQIARLLTSSAAEQHKRAGMKLLGNIANFLAVPSSVAAPGRREGAQAVISCLFQGLDQSGPLSACLREWLEGQMNELLTGKPKGKASALELLSLVIEAGGIDTLTKQREVISAILFVIMQAEAAAPKAQECLEKLGSASPQLVWEMTCVDLLPRLSEPQSGMGDAHCLSCLVAGLGRHIGAYASALLPAIVRGCTRKDPEVRLVFARALSDVVKAVALFPEEKGSVRARHDGTQAKKYNSDADSEQLVQCLLRGEPLPLLSKACLPQAVQKGLRNDLSLRPYQWEGATWLDFLRRTGTCGILADEMGLGKTLQALIAVALSHSTSSKAAAGVSAPPNMSLVLCPPTLMNHWEAETKKFFDPSLLSPLAYCGTASKRKALAKKLKAKRQAPTLVIASYSILRQDSAFLTSQSWLYVVLDEGHLLKNYNTQAATAARQLDSVHRLALTGTPIHNSVAELWSVFEFLMPGYLGTSAAFRKGFITPVKQAFESSSEAAAALNGFESLRQLHKQVLPFVLRRLKQDVLDDLPGKLITDVLCDMSPSQRELYDSLCNAGGSAGVIQNADGLPSRNTLKSLQKLQKICVHPMLAQDGTQGADHERLNTSGLLEASGKLLALRDLLQECVPSSVPVEEAGPEVEVEVDPQEEDEQESPKEGVDVANTEAFAAGSRLSDGKCLIFAQHKEALDVVESCLLRPHMPAMRYERLDGGVPLASRAAIVERFTSDPSIQLLLLTIRVGGLGLNLTVADKVIFLESSWNPQVDLQAMDRVHRIGQRRAVNIYRLVMKCFLNQPICFIRSHTSYSNYERGMLRGTASRDRALTLEPIELAANSPKRCIMRWLSLLDLIPSYPSSQDSIDERVMKIQRHKLEVAHAVVNKDNANLFANNTQEVLGRLEESVAAPQESREAPADELWLQVMVSPVSCSMIMSPSICLLSLPLFRWALQLRLLTC
ncbi:unnamed protein product [Chrysoparadoxa australica]